MGDHEFEKWLEGLLSQDLSAGTEDFREGLLNQCLESLGAGQTIELDDSDLELLAAAGDVAAFGLGSDRVDRGV